jgi:hypothetical protein
MVTLRNSKIWLTTLLIIAMLGHFGLGHRDVSVFVLCFGADGHVAIEYVGPVHGTGLDKSTEITGDATAFSIDSALPCESPCTDISMDGNDHIPLPLTDLLKVSIDIGLLPAFFLLSLLVFYARVIIRQSAFSDPPFTDSRLLALRSTVLLI